jgi:hypothetical protein
MPSLPGNTRLVYAAIQAGKGTPAATPTIVFEISGDAALSPNRLLIQLPETDAASQQPDNVVVGAEPGGGWSSWLRSSQSDFLAQACLGANADTGSNPNYTHTATPAAASAMPYVTLWDVLPSSMCTRYDDARISSLAFSGEALQGISVAVTAVALSAQLNVTAPTLPATLAADRALAYPDVTATIGGVANGTVDAWSLTINRNVTLLRGDLGLAAYDSVPGLLGVEGTFRKIYQNDDEYNRHHGGSAAATSLTTTIFEEALDILVQENANRSVRFTSSAIQYTETTIPVDVGGAPILMTQTFRTRGQAVLGNNITAITKNGFATPVTAR